MTHGRIITETRIGREKYAPRMKWQRFYKACRNLIAVSNNVYWYDYQREIAQRMVRAMVDREATEIVVMLPRQSGKTEVVADVCAAMMMLAPLAYKDDYGTGFRIGFFAPKQDRAQIIYNRLRERFDGPVLKELGITVQTSNGDTFTLSNGSVARCITANKNSNSEGHTLDLIVIDECQDVESQVLLKSIWPMGTATRASKVMIGTATTVKRYFYDVQVREKDTDRCFISNVDRVISDRRKLAEATGKDWHLNYEVDFGQQLKARGRDDYIRMAYYLEWVLERGMFITIERLQDLALPYRRMREFPLTVYAGLDLGKESDSTVLTVLTPHCPVDGLTIQTSDGQRHVLKAGDVLWDQDTQRHHLFILDWLRFTGDRYSDQVPQIVDYLKRFPKLKNLTIDSTGVGNAVKEMFSSSGLSEVINPFTFTSGQETSDLWEDLMRAMPMKAIIHFPMGEGWTYEQALKNPPDNDTRIFITEMTNLEKIWKGQMLKCGTEEGADRHDDMCASLALANWGFTRFGGMRLDSIPLFFNDETGEASDESLSLDSIFGDGAYAL